jgi:ribosomal protein S18 acetylase RimI-like enzyme
VVDPAVADRVLLVEVDGAVVGFLTLRFNNDLESEIVLNGVDPEYQRRGLYSALVEAALALSSTRGATRCIVSTQLTNRSVQRVWARLGFELSAARHTFHLWLE